MVASNRCATEVARRSWSRGTIPPKAYAEQWETDSATRGRRCACFALDLPAESTGPSEEGIADEEIRDRLTEATIDEKMAAKAERLRSPKLMRMAEKKPAAADSRPAVEGSPAAPSTTCVRASACAPTGSANPAQRIQGARRSTCSRPCCRTTARGGDPAAQPYRDSGGIQQPGP